MVATPRPDSTSPEELRLTALLGLINLQSLGSVVARALNHRSDASPNIRREFNFAIRDSVKVRGFKNSDLAPAVKLKELVLHQLHHSEQLFSAVLKTWAESHAVLVATISAHLQSKGITVAFPDFAQRRLRGYWRHDDWRSEQDEILELHTDYNQSDVALMLCYLTGRMPTLTDDTSDEADDLHDVPFLTQIRTYFEQLRPDSPLWDTSIPELLDSVKRTLDAKAVERQMVASRRAFDATINEFMNRYSSRLEWLGLARDSWVPPLDLNSLDVLEVQALLNTLSNLIDDYESTPIDGSSMDESQRLMERRSQTLRRIDDTKSELDKVLAADKGPDGPPFDGDGQELTSETPIEDARNEATLLKLDVSHGVLDFDPETVRYNIDLEGDVETLIVTAVAADPRAVIEVVNASPDSNWGHAISCSDGAFAVPILHGDDTVVSIRVSTEDGETSQIYTVNVTDAGFDDIVVSDIHLSDGEIVFDPLVSEYESIVENSVDSLTITPMLSDPRAAVRTVAKDEIGNVVDVMTLGDGSFKIPSLPVGQTLVSIAVGAEAAPISDAYVIAVIRRANADVTLNSLSLSAVTLDFDPRQTEYNVDLPAEIENMDIVPETTHGGATVSVAAQLQDTGPTAGLDSQDGVFRVTGIGEGRSVVTLSVVSEDKTANQDYVLHIVRHSGAGPNLERLLWSRVMHDDIAGAYWIAESLQARQLPAPVPPLLLMAVQGARWLSPVWDQYVEDLAAIVSEVSIGDDEDSHVLLRLAASIRPSLVAPETNLLAWVSSPRCLPEIEMLVSAVRDFASRGYALRSELINPGQGDEALQTLISAASADLRLWLDEARQHHTRFARANSVWQHLCSNGLLSVMLPHVIHDNREHVEMVRSNLAEMDRESAATETINQIDRFLLGHSVPKADITGTARTWLLRRMREATTRITHWCELVELERAARQQDAGNWLQEQVIILREKIRVQYPNAIAALLRLSADSDKASLAASAQCMARSLDDLLDHLGLSIQIGPRHATTAIVEDLRAMNAKAASNQGGEASLGFLRAAVAKRLLWLPAVDLDDSGWPTKQSQLADLPSEDLSLDDAMRVRIENDDFRFFDFLSSGVAYDRQLVLRDAYAHELKAAQDTLYDRIPKVREEVEQAANDGVIEYEGAQWNSLVGQLADIDVEQTLNFRFVHDSLERIRNSVKEDRERRREELNGEWAQLSLTFKDGAPADAAFLADSENTFRLASSPTSPDIRVMEDCVSGLRNYRSGEQPNLPVTPRRDHGNRLEDFLSFADGISDPQSYAAESKGLRMLRRQLVAEV